MYANNDSATRQCLMLMLLLPTPHLLFFLPFISLGTSVLNVASLCELYQNHFNIDQSCLRVRRNVFHLPI